MSDFTPKKLDENLINGGKQYKSGDVVQPIAINDPIEAILLLQEETATVPILQSEINSIKKQTEKHSKDIQNLYAISLSNNLYGILQTTQAYKTRETAEGANIIDGQYAPVTRIDGATTFSQGIARNAFFKGIKSESKNLLNTKGEIFASQGSLYYNEGKVTAENTNPNATDFVIFKNMLMSEQYTFSASPSYPEGRIIICTRGRVYNTQGQVDTSATENTFYSTEVKNQTGESYKTYVKSISANTPYTFIADSHFFIGIVMYLPSSVSDRTCIVEDLQIVRGLDISAYVPYSNDEGFVYDNPLELGEWDYALPQEGKVYKGTETHRITLSNVAAIGGKGQTDIAYYYEVKLNTNNLKKGKGDNYLISNMDIVRPSSTTPYEKGIYWANSTGVSIIFWSKKEINFWDTRADLIAWLENNPVSVAFAIEERETDVAPQRTTTIAYKGGTETVIQGDTDNSGFGTIPTITQEYFELVGGDK